jgi:hypothetical protein
MAWANFCITSSEGPEIRFELADCIAVHQLLRRLLMTFNELMSLVAFTTPFICSLESGWKADKSLGALLGLIVGLILSVGSFLAVRFLFKRVRHHPKLSTANPGVIWTGISWILAVAVFVWIFGFAFFGMWLTRFVIHNIAG